MQQLAVLTSRQQSANAVSVSKGSTGWVSSWVITSLKVAWLRSAQECHSTDPGLHASQRHKTVSSLASVQD